MRSTAERANDVKRMPLYEFIAQQSGTPKEYVMPVPFFNVLNGGVHSGNTMAFQEFMIAPVGASSFADAVRMGAEVYSELKGVVTEKFGKSGQSACCSCIGSRSLQNVITGRSLWY